MYHRVVEDCPVWVLMEYLLLPCHSHSSNLKIHTHRYINILLDVSRHIFRNTQYQLTEGSLRSTCTPCFPAPLTPGHQLLFLPGF